MEEWYLVKYLRLTMNLYNKKKYILFLVFLIYVIGCSSSVNFIPNELPTAIVGKPYYIEIQIQGGTPVASLTWDVFPENNGLCIESIEKEGYWEKDFLRIHGSPTKATDMKITLNGFTYGTSLPGKKFKKIYLLKVKEIE